MNSTLSWVVLPMPSPLVWEDSTTRRIVEEALSSDWEATAPQGFDTGLIVIDRFAGIRWTLTGVISEDVVTKTFKIVMKAFLTLQKTLPWNPRPIVQLSVLRDGNCGFDCSEAVLHKALENDDFRVKSVSKLGSTRFAQLFEVHLDDIR